MIHLFSNYNYEQIIYLCLGSFSNADVRQLRHARKQCN